MYTLGEKIVPREIEQEIKDSYISYAMSVIVGRALPDARDGLKPVHRRILYAMRELGLDSGKPHKKSARIVGECFVKNTLVLTQRGLIPIPEIRRGELVYTERGQCRVTELYEMPVRALLKVTLENGTSNVVTPGQQFRVLTQDLEFVWKEARQLTTSDYVVVRASYPELRRAVELRPVCPEDPKVFDEDIAYLLGFWLSDGWIEKERGRVGFYSNTKAVIERIVRVLHTQFGLPVYLQEKRYDIKTKDGTQHRVGYQARVSRDDFSEFLRLNFGISAWDAWTKEIPLTLFRSPRSVIWAFVSGLIDGDGSVHTEYNAIHYGSTSEKLIDQLALLLQHQGVFSRRGVQQPKGSSVINGRSVATRRLFYYLEIKGSNARLLAKKLRVKNPMKRDRLSRIAHGRLKKTKHEIIPWAGEKIFAELSQYHLGSGWYQAADGQKFRRGVKYATGAKIRYSRDLRAKPLRRSQLIEWGIAEKLQRIGSPLAETVNHVERDDLYFFRVVGVREAPAEKTYDIQVENEHQFLANGMVVHNCLGKYHPHGDLAVYDALVRMAQDFSMRHPLIDGQGNWGSVDGDAPAAMRYTEARLAQIAEELLDDLEKETVDFAPNFDNSLTEPKVLPAKLPNLLVNGSSGIAVGMATNIPPHNLGETVDAACALIDEPDIEAAALMRHVKGPDFPTGAIICGRDGIADAYTSGRGSLRIRSKVQIEQLKGNRQAIVITELPYQVNKANLIEAIAKLVQDKHVEGISDLRDESDRDGMRVVIELKRDANDQVVLNQLYKHTQMETTFGIILLALVDGRPRVLSLKQLLEAFIEHRKDVVIRRTKFELARAQERAHILEGLKKALAHLDAIIKTIRQSKSPQEAREALVKKFDLSERQAQAILEMQLQRLTALERDKLEAEYLELIKKIAYYEMLLKSERKVLELIKEELLDVKKKYYDERRTEIVGEIKDLKIEDLIAEEDVVITVSHRGYIKRLPVSAYRKQRRGGVGVTAVESNEDDFAEDLFVASTHETLMFFTNQGRCYWLKVHEVPQASRYARGTALINLISLQKDEQVRAYVPVKAFDPNQFLVMATRQGTVKKTKLEAYSNPRKAGIIAITLDKGDELIEAKIVDPKRELSLITKQGKAIRFPEEQARDVGRSARGVRGIRLNKDDEVVSMVIVSPKDTLLTVTRLGFGKRTLVEEYRVQSRGGKGIINISVTKKNGEVVGAKMVTDRDEIMLISQEGMMVRCAVKDVRSTGRAAQGVRLINMKGKDVVASIARVAPRDEEEAVKVLETAQPAAPASAPAEVSTEDAPAEAPKAEKAAAKAEAKPKPKPAAAKQSTAPAVKPKSKRKK